METDAKNGWVSPGAFAAFTGCLGVIGGALISPGLQYLNRDREMDIKMVEIGIGILRADPKENVTPAREWAITIIEKHSKTTFNDATKEALRKNSLPIITAITSANTLTLTDFNNAPLSIRRPSDGSVEVK